MLVSIVTNKKFWQIVTKNQYRDIVIDNQGEINDLFYFPNKLQRENINSSWNITNIMLYMFLFFL